MRAAKFFWLILTILFIANTGLISQSNWNDRDSVALEKAVDEIAQSPKTNELARRSRIGAVLKKFNPPVTHQLYWQLTEMRVNSFKREYKHDSAFYFLDTYLERMKSLNQRFLQTQAYNTRGWLNIHVHKPGDAIADFENARKIHLADGKASDAAYMLFMQSYVLTQQERTIESNAKLNQAIREYEKLNDSTMLSTCYEAIASNYSMSGRYIEALETYDKALLLGKNTTDYYLLRSIWHNMAITYKKAGKLEKSSQAYDKALELLTKDEQVDSTDFYLIQLNKSLLNIERNQLSGVEEKLLGVLSHVDHLENITFKMEANQALYKYYSKAGKYDKALKYLEKTMGYRDSLVNVERDREVTLVESQLKLEEKNRQIAEQNNKIEKQELFRNSLIAIVALLIVLAFFIFRSALLTRRANSIISQQKKDVELKKEELERKNREITDSIAYARNIQSAILPAIPFIKSVLPHSFVFYQPKDIVSGDFYWIEKIGSKTFIAACDCTGHGVPGAMVSVVCHHALNRAIHEKALYEPNLILDSVSLMVEEFFHTSANEGIYDGMDISLCVLEPGKPISWAGANNPIWLFRNTLNQSEIIIESGDKQPVGRNEFRKPFTLKKLDVKPGDRVYLFSDGYASQFGGEDGKKLTRKKFKEILLSMQKFPIESHGNRLSAFIEEYRKNEEQIDDLLVMGFEIT